MPGRRDRPGAVDDARLGQRLLDHLAGVPAGPAQHQHRAVGAAGGPLDVPAARLAQEARSRSDRASRGRAGADVVVGAQGVGHAHRQK